MLNYTVAGIEKRYLPIVHLLYTFIVFQYLTHVDRRKSRALSKANIKIESRRGSRAPSRGDIFSIENETPVRT